MTNSLVGKKLGKYSVRSMLGQGGMASVYVGYQEDIDREVAVKVLAPHPGQDARFLSRFRQEARTIARLQHPHIVPVYDYGDEGGVLYLVMAYIRGGTLSERIRRGPLSVADTERLLREIGGALDYAHRQSIIHRDIKPANILIDREGHALLTDFGIAKLMEDSSAGLTGTGNMVGTPAYMSPEQAQSSTVDARSDVYALGALAFEMLTGKPPFVGENAMQTIMKHLTAPPPLHLLPPPFVPVLGRALAKAPEERYQSAAEFVEDFSRAFRGEATADPMAGATLNMTGTGMPGAFMPPTSGGTGSASVYQSQPSMPINPSLTGTNPPLTTIIQQQTINPFVLLGGFAIIAVLVVAVVLLVLNQAPQGGTPPREFGAGPGVEVIIAPTAPPSVPQVPIFGRVAFSSSSSLGDTVGVRVDNLARPTGLYAVWLLNSTADAPLALGEIAVDPLGAGAINYTSPDAVNLAITYNQVIITDEAALGDAPAGPVRYRGGVPAEVAAALAEILVASPEGIPPRAAAPVDDEAEPGSRGYREAALPGSGNASLALSAFAEAQIAQQHAGLAARATSLVSMKTHAEHTINILRGRQAQEDLDGNGRIENPGRGFGVPYFLDLIDAQLATITGAADASPQVQGQAELIRVCIVNARGWVDGILERERTMLASATIDAVQVQIEESTLLAAQLTNGTDLNENGAVEPFEGECGLNQILEFGVSVANFSIVLAEPA